MRSEPFAPRSRWAPRSFASPQHWGPQSRCSWGSERQTPPGHHGPSHLRGSPMSWAPGEWFFLGKILGNFDEHWMNIMICAIELALKVFGFHEVICSKTPGKSAYTDFLQVWHCFSGFPGGLLNLVRKNMQKLRKMPKQHVVKQGNGANYQLIQSIQKPKTQINGLGWQVVWGSSL